MTVSRVLMILSITGFRNSKTIDTFEPEKCRSAYTACTKIFEMFEV